MSASRTIPRSPSKGKLLIVGGYVFSFTCATTSAAEVLVVTDRQHPVSVGPTVRVIALDAPGQLIESEFPAHLPADSERATVVARQAMEDAGASFQTRLALACQDVIEAWTLGISKIPAVVVDRQYVVYGERDVNRAVSLIERYRRTQP